MQREAKQTPKNWGDNKLPPTTSPKTENPKNK